jgi:hypothetical protein
MIVANRRALARIPNHGSKPAPPNSTSHSKAPLPALLPSLASHRDLVSFVINVFQPLFGKKGGIPPRLNQIFRNKTSD